MLLVQYCPSFSSPACSPPKLCHPIAWPFPMTQAKRRVIPCHISGHPHSHAEPWPGVLWISTGTTHLTSLRRFTFTLKCSQVKVDFTVLSSQGKAGTLSRAPQQVLSPRLTTRQSCTPSMATSMAHCLVGPGGTGTGVGSMRVARSRGGARSVNLR